MKARESLNRRLIYELFPPLPYNLTTHLHFTKYQSQPELNYYGYLNLSTSNLYATTRILYRHSLYLDAVASNNHINKLRPDNTMSLSSLSTSESFPYSSEMSVLTSQETSFSLTSTACTSMTSCSKDPEMRFAEKLAALLTTALVLLWLLVQAMDNVLVFVGVCGALWAVYGKARCFSQEQRNDTPQHDINEVHEVLDKTDDLPVILEFDDGESSAEDPPPVSNRVDSPLDADELVQVEFVEPFSWSGVPDDIRHRMEFLMHQHCHPTFNDGNMDDACWARLRKNELLDPFYDCQEAMSETSDYGYPSAPGRSVQQDAYDIEYMYNILKNDLTPELQEHLLHHHADYWFRYRCGVTNSNICRELLILQWHALRSPNVRISCMEDIIYLDLPRVRRHRPECGIHSRYSCSLNSGVRPYLTDEEELVINVGASDYGYYNEQEVLSELQRTLLTNECFFKLKGKNSVPNWLDGIEDNELYDPNGYDPCRCGIAASKALTQYRDELEPGYTPNLANISEFPIALLPCSVSVQSIARKVSGREFVVIPQLPRSQHIIQECHIHALLTNNIFVLIDTSFHDINDRIEGQNLYLPAPGMHKTTVFSHGFQTQPGFLEIPYHQLAPRCKHGHLHPPSSQCCRICYLGGNHENCQECRAFYASV